jgi:hypothetical protein
VGSYISISEKYQIIMLVQVCPQYCTGHTYTNKNYSIYLKSKFNWVLYVWVFKAGFHFITHSGLELMSLLSLPPECWDYRYAPPLPAGFIY